MENIDPPNPDVPPVPEIGNNDKTGTLSVRQPMRLLTLLDTTCKEQGTTRTELIRMLLEQLGNPAPPVPDESELTRQNQELQEALQELTSRYNALLQQPKDSDYAAELEVDLLKAVKMACNAILPTRSDFRKHLKHFSRLESDRT